MKDLKASVLELLGELAPEADLGALDPAGDLREQLDIDSLDFLRFIVLLHDTLGISVPESDYRKLLTLDGCLEYLSSRRGSGPSTAPGAS